MNTTSSIKLTSKVKALPMQPHLVAQTLAGNKTLTSRLINPQPRSLHNIINGAPYPNWKGEYLANIEGVIQSIKPRYQAGDLLYITEKHYIESFYDKMDGQGVCKVCYDDKIGIGNGLTRTNTARHIISENTLRKLKPASRWRRARFMFRDFARAVVLVEEVYPARVQDLTEEDAIAEGIERMPRVHWWKNYQNDPLPGTSSAVHSFSTLWNSIHTAPRETWAANPWVWRYRYRLVWQGSSLHLHLPELIDSLKSEAAV